jgi:hypothetical protein
MSKRWGTWASWGVVGRLAAAARTGPSSLRSLAVVMTGCRTTPAIPFTETSYMIRPPAINPPSAVGTSADACGIPVARVQRACPSGSNRTIVPFQVSAAVPPSPAGTTAVAMSNPPVTSRSHMTAPSGESLTRSGCGGLRAECG